MTNIQKNKIKLLHQFLKDNNMELRGREIVIQFNADNYKAENNCKVFDLILGWIRGSNANIKELNQITPKVKNHWIIDENDTMRSLI